MKKLWNFITKPPKWYVNLMFWGSLALTLVSIVAFFVVSEIPGARSLQTYWALNAAFNAGTALVWWVIDRRRKPVI